MNIALFLRSRASSCLSPPASSPSSSSSTSCPSFSSLIPAHLRFHLCHLIPAAYQSLLNSYVFLGFSSSGMLMSYRLADVVEQHDHADNDSDQTIFIQFWRFVASQPLVLITEIHIQTTAAQQVHTLLPDTHSHPHIEMLETDDQRCFVVCVHPSLSPAVSSANDSGYVDVCVAVVVIPSPCSLSSLPIKDLYVLHFHHIHRQLSMDSHHIQIDIQTDIHPGTYRLTTRDECSVCSCQINLVTMTTERTTTREQTFTNKETDTQRRRSACSCFQNKSWIDECMNPMNVARFSVLSSCSSLPVYSLCVQVSHPCVLDVEHLLSCCLSTADCGSVLDYCLLLPLDFAEYLSTCANIRPAVLCVKVVQDQATQSRILSLLLMIDFARLHHCCIQVHTPTGNHTIQQTADILLKQWEQSVRRELSAQRQKRQAHKWDNAGLLSAGLSLNLLVHPWLSCAVVL